MNQNVSSVHGPEPCYALVQGCMGALLGKGALKLDLTLTGWVIVLLLGLVCVWILPVSVNMHPVTSLFAGYVIGFAIAHVLGLRPAHHSV